MERRVSPEPEVIEAGVLLVGATRVTVEGREMMRYILVCPHGKTDLFDPWMADEGAVRMSLISQHQTEASCDCVVGQR